MTWQRERRTGRTVWIEEVMMGLSYSIKYPQQLCCVTVYVCVYTHTHTVPDFFFGTFMPSNVGSPEKVIITPQVN